MNERKHEQTVKDVGIDNDCLCIELLNGLRLTGPLRTKPIHREPVVPAESHALPSSDLIHSAVTG